MSPLMIGLCIGGLIVLLIVTLIIRGIRRQNYRFNVSGEIRDRALQARYIYEVDVAMRELSTVLKSRGDLYCNRIHFMRNHRSKMVNDRAPYAPYEVIRDACALLDTPDDSCDDDICRAAQKALDELDIKALRKQKAPKGVIARAREKRQEIIAARELLRKMPR